MEFYGYNVSPQSVWDDIRNVKKYNGLTASEFMKTPVIDEDGNIVKDANGKFKYHTYKEFKENVQNVMSKNLTSIQKIQQDSLFEGTVNLANAPMQRSVSQVVQDIAGPQSQWRKASKIIKGNGSVIVWDLETVGNITSHVKDGYAGITEFGIDFRDYVDGQRIIKDTPTGYSFAIGFSKQQASGLTDLVKRFERGEWDTFNNSERSTIQRLSMLGSTVDNKGRIVPIKNINDRYADATIDFLGNKQFKIVKELGPANFNPETMIRGIQIGSEIYKDATPERVLNALMPIIEKGADSDNTVVAGANTAFDISAAARVGESLGIKIDEDKLYAQQLDIISGTRVIAAGHTQSINTFSKNVHDGIITNPNQAGNVESQAQSLQMGKAQTHYSLQDIFNEGDILTTRKYANGASYIDTVIESAENIKLTPYELENTIFLINRGSIINDNGDMSVRPDASGAIAPSMQTYPTSNDFWRIGEHSGYVENYVMPDGSEQNRYVLELINDADAENKVYKTYDSKDQLINAFGKDMTPVQIDRITPEQRIEQTMMHYADEGRREYERLFDPKLVRLNGNADEGGFSRLTQYVDLVDKLNSPDQRGFKTNQELRPSLVKRIREYANANNEPLLKSEYQIEAFAGMFEKITDERAMIDDIIGYINSDTYKDSNNITKTEMARRARERVLSEISNKKITTNIDGQVVEIPKYVSYTPSSPRYAMTDVFGIDLNVGDSTTRINAFSVDTALSDLSRVSKDLDIDKAMSIVNDLALREVINADAVERLSKSANLNINTSGSYAFMQDLAYELSQITQPLREVDNPINFISLIKQEKSEMKPNGMTVDEHLHAIQQRDPNSFVHPDSVPYTAEQVIALRNKTLHSIGNERKAGTKSKYQLSVGSDNNYKLSTIYKREKLNAGIIKQEIDNVSNIPITFYQDASSFAKQMESLQAQLNFSDKEFDYVKQFFNTTDENDFSKPYSINTYKDLQSFVIAPTEANKNAYVLVTTPEHSNKIIDTLMRSVEDTNIQESMKTFGGISELFGQDASIVSLHGVTKHALSTINNNEIAGIIGEEASDVLDDGTIQAKRIASMVSVHQGENFEKFLNPILDFYTLRGGNNGPKVMGEIKSGAEDLVSTLRITGKSFLEKTLDGKFEEATTQLKKSQDRKLENLASPSSYRGRVEYTDGVATVKRMPNYHPADFLHAYETDVSKLRDLFDILATQKSTEENSVQEMLRLFNNEKNILYVKGGPDTSLSPNQARSVMRSNEWNEFYIKHLFHGNVSKDNLIGGSNFSDISKFDKSIFEIMQESISRDTSGLFDDSVNDALNMFAKTVPYINQILPESAVKHDVVSYLPPGAFNPFAGLYSTLRPTYVQQNRPIYLDLDDFDKQALEYDNYTYAGQSYISKMEQVAKENIDVKAPSGKDFDTMTRSISTRFKQIGDYELQMKYAEVSSQLDDIAAKGYRPEEVRAVFDYMRNDMSSVNEGKLFYDPLMGSRNAYRDADGKKITLYKNIETINEYKTKKLLYGLDGKTIKGGDVIGVRSNGKSIIYKGADFVFTKDYANELLEKGFTYVIPERSAIGDIKIMIGSEKGMAHTISKEALDSIPALKDLTTAKKIMLAHDIFQKMFDANVVGKIAAFKHGNNPATESTWNVISTAYVRNGQGQQLIDLINSNSDTRDLFKDFHLQLNNKDGSIIVENTNSKNLTSAVSSLESLIREKTDSVGLSNINKSIVDELDYNVANNVIRANVQRVHINESLSTRLRFDQRIEQNARLRTREPGQALTKTIDDKYIESIKEYAFRDNLGVADDFLNSELGAIKGVSDIYNTQRLDDVRSHNRAVVNNRRNAKGISEALDYFHNPAGLDVKNANILELSMTDLMTKYKVPKNGASVKDFEKFLFYIDGKPSDALKQLGSSKDGFDFNKATNSIYINLEQTINYRGRDINGVLIPIQNSVTNVGDNQFFTESQGITARLLRELLDITKNPIDKKEHKSQAVRFTEAIDTFTQGLSKQSAIMDKDSDVYKAYGTFVLPNSAQFQAQDETPALIKSMMTDEVNELLGKKDYLSKRLANGDLEAISEYDKTLQRLDDILKEASKEVESGKLPTMVALDHSPFKDLSIMEVDGKQYYNNLAATGDAGFKAMGYDFGQAGMDLVNAHINQDYSNIPSIANKTPFKVRDDEIKIVSDRIKALGIEDLQDVNETNVLTKINEYFIKKYDTGVDEINIKKVNESIVRGDIQKIFRTFDDIGKRYTKEVGIMAEHLRYPVFGIQPNMNIVYDESVEGISLRYFNPVTSMHINVDFDGDTAFAAALLDGGSFAKVSNRRLANALEVHKRSIQNNNKLLAEMIKDGDAFKVDLLNDYEGLTAHMLELFKADEYDKGIKQWAKNNNVAYKSVSELTEGQIYAANHSAEMRNAWDRVGLNTITDPDIRFASLAIPARKENIGSISVPSLNLRATVEDMTMLKGLDDATRLNYEEILNDLINTSTKDRGLTGIMEQKGIDVKHIVDAFGIADTPKWATGLNKMFGNSKYAYSNGLANMVTASKSVLFKNTDESVQSIVNDILNPKHTRQYFIDQEQSYIEQGSKLADVARAKRYLRGVYDIASDDTAKALYNLKIKKGSWEQQQMALEEVRKYIPENTYHVLESNFEDVIRHAQSDARIQLERDNIYFRTATATDPVQNAWRFVHDNKKGPYLEELTMDEFKPTGYTYKLQGETNIDINKDIDKFFNGHKISASAYYLKESPEVLDTTISILKKQSQVDILNTLIIDSDNNIIPLRQDKVKAIQDATPVGYDVLQKYLYNMSSSQYDDINESLNVYQYAINAKEITRKDSVDSLIKNLNQDIINNPDKYANKSEFVNYADIIQHKLITDMGGQEIFNRTKNRMNKLDGLSFGAEQQKSYKESLDFLNKGLYDIINEKTRLDSSFESIKANIDMLTGNTVKPLQDLYATAPDVTADTVAKMRMHNQQVVNQVQDDIYKLFKNTDQMDALFEWDNVSGLSKVGFGEYIGINFSKLNKKDIEEIMSKSTDDITGIHKYAVEHTKKALSSYQKLDTRDIRNASSALVGRKYVSSSEVNEVIVNNQKVLSNVLDSIDESTIKTASKMKRKTISGSTFDAAKDALAHIPLKTVGVVVGSLAALGIANNLLHNQKNQSPLSPARKDGNDTPYTGSDTPAPMQQAPMSQKRTIYHDSGSGLNFKVSARTRNFIDDRNNAKLIGMAGGGQASVYSQSDMSGVSDNWLANKFAELT